MSIQGQAQSTVNRKDLLTVLLQQQQISKVEVKEIYMEPAQRAPLHSHPVPVVGYVAEGTLVYQIKGGSVQTLKKGDAFYEPAGVAIAHFDNASKDHPVKFIAFYLTNGDKKLVEILPETADIR